MPKATAEAATTSSVQPTCNPPPRNTERTHWRTWERESSSPTSKSSRATPISARSSTSCVAPIRPNPLGPTRIPATRKPTRDGADNRCASATMGIAMPTSSVRSISNLVSDTLFLPQSRERGKRRVGTLPKFPIQIEPDDRVDPPPERDTLVDRSPPSFIVLRQQPRRPDKRIH